MTRSTGEWFVVALVLAGHLADHAPMFVHKVEQPNLPHDDPFWTSTLETTWRGSLEDAVAWVLLLQDLRKANDEQQYLALEFAEAATLRDAWDEAKEVSNR